MRSIALAFLLAGAALGGQSLVLSTTTTVNLPSPSTPWANPWRIEFQAHSITPGSGLQNAFGDSGNGVQVATQSDGTIAVTDKRDSTPGGSNCVLTPTGANSLIRAQRDMVANTFTCEIWNYDGTGHSTQSIPILGIASPPWTYSGTDLGLGATMSLGFYRVFSTLVPVNSRPPTTADHGDYTELKFDGDLTDSSVSGHGSGASGSTFATTPNQIPVALLKTLGAPAWSNWVSLRAGSGAQLDGTGSYSLSDSSSSVSYSWSQVSGSSTAQWSSTSVAQPKLYGVIFGPYVFQLTVADSTGSASQTLEVGAVATDSNGVVVNADPNADIIFGPMIAFGKNAWGYADERAKYMSEARLQALKVGGLAPASWQVARAGTVAWTYGQDGNQTGYSGVPSKSTLALDITSATQLTMRVSDASVFDLSVLPAHILVGTIAAKKEDIRICSVSGNDLTICYDGRGQANPAGETYRTNAQAWPTGTQVFQFVVKGSGTAFKTVLCPSGFAPSPGGAVLYSVGTLAATAGSSSIVGSGVNWTNGNGIYPNTEVIFSGTHGGVPFVFAAYVTTVTNSTHMALSRAFPADADTASGLTYSIITPDVRQIALHYTRDSDGSDAQLPLGIAACESDTRVYLISGFDIGSISGVKAMSGLAYSYAANPGYSAENGVNFYGEDLGHLALYLRSGYRIAREASWLLSDQWISSPYVAGGDFGGQPLNYGGGAMGAFAAAVLNTNDPNRPSWSDLRNFVGRGYAVANADCANGDTRNRGYSTAIVTLAALFDPDLTYKAQHQAKMVTLNGIDQGCKTADNSFRSAGDRWNNSSSPPMTVTPGSTTVTATSGTFDAFPTVCDGLASGTATVTAGSAVLTGTGFVSGYKISLTGTKAGIPYTTYAMYVFNSSTSITLGVLWNGDNGAVSWMIGSSQDVTSIGRDTSDSQQSKNWMCLKNSSTQITLNKPWDGSNFTDEYLYHYVLAGNGQQSLMLGIKITQMMLASHLPTVGPSYLALAQNAAQWVHDVGFDSVTGGMHYGSLFEACANEAPVNPAVSLDWRTPGCGFGLGNTDGAVTNGAEVSPFLRVLYEANPTQANRDFGDAYFTKIWGYAPYTAAGFGTTPTPSNSLVNGYLSSFKWPGFFMGVGAEHQWAAVRKGTTAAIPRTELVSIQLSAVAGAASTLITVTAPSGAVTTQTCSISPCSVITDGRQGDHLLSIAYLSSGGSTLKTFPTWVLHVE